MRTRNCENKKSIIPFVNNRFRNILKIDARRHRDTENVMAADMEVESGDSLSMDLLSAAVRVKHWTVAYQRVQI